MATATATAANFEGPIGNGDYRRVAPARVIRTAEKNKLHTIRNN